MASDFLSGTNMMIHVKEWTLMQIMTHSTYIMYIDGKHNDCRSQQGAEITRYSTY